MAFPFFTAQTISRTKLLLLLLTGSLTVLVGCGSTPQVASSQHVPWRVPLGEGKTTPFPDAGIRSLFNRDGEVIAAGWKAVGANEVFRSDIALAAYDADTGQAKWTASKEGLTTSSYSPMAFAEERVYTTTSTGYLLVLEGASPTHIKAVQYGLGSVVHYPVLSDTRLIYLRGVLLDRLPDQYIPAIFAISKVSMKEVWRYSPPDTDDLSKLVLDVHKNRLLIATRLGELLAVDTTNGRPTLLRKGLPRAPLALVQTEDALFWLAPTGALRLDPGRYNTIWKIHESLGIKSRAYPTGRVNSVYPYPAGIAGQRLFLPAEGMRLLEIDVADGRVSRIYTLPENTDPRLYLYAREGIVFGTRDTGTKGAYRKTDLIWLDRKTSQRRILYTGSVSAKRGDQPMTTDNRHLYVAAKDEIVGVPLPVRIP